MAKYPNCTFSRFRDSQKHRTRPGWFPKIDGFGNAYSSKYGNNMVMFCKFTNWFPIARTDSRRAVFASRIIVKPNDFQLPPWEHECFFNPQLMARWMLAGGTIFVYIRHYHPPNLTWWLATIMYCVAIPFAKFLRDHVLSIEATT